MQLAEAQAHRSITREAQFRTAVALDVARARGCDSLECGAAAAHFCPVAYGSPNAVFVVLVTQDDNGNMRALVSDDNRQLPMLPSGGDGRSARQARVGVASRFCATPNLPCVGSTRTRFLCSTDRGSLSLRVRFLALCPELSRSSRRGGRWRKWQAAAYIFQSLPPCLVWLRTVNVEPPFRSWTSQTVPCVLGASCRYPTLRRRCRQHGRHSCIILRRWTRVLGGCSLR